MWFKLAENTCLNECVRVSLFFRKTDIWRHFHRLYPPSTDRLSVFAGIASIPHDVFRPKVPTCNITLPLLTAVQLPLKPPWHIALDETSIASFWGSVFTPDCSPATAYMLSLTQEMFSIMGSSLGTHVCMQVVVRNSLFHLLQRHANHFDLAWKIKNYGAWGKIYMLPIWFSVLLSL